MAKRKPKQEKDNPKQKDALLSGILKWCWILLVVGLLLGLAIMTLVSYTRMPDTEELENPDYEYATIVYAEGGEELGKYFSKNREGVLYEDINPLLIKALIATEDERFYKHSGIDAKGTVRAVLFMGRKGGASTISQQLAKQFFTKRSRSFIKRVWQKLKEWAIAIQFEKRYTKEEILAMYLNKFDFIYSSHGVSAAAKTYFGKDQRDLAIDECAMLVGMLKNPYLYNPKKNPENAAVRRNVVLNQMVRSGFLATGDLESIKAKPIDMSDFKRTNHYEGPAPYFLQTLKQDLKKILEDESFRKPDGTPYNLDEDGLRIYTTIDLKYQQHAEAAMLEHMKTLQASYFNLWSDKDPWTYKASAKEKEQRKEFLNKAVRESDRYSNMKNQLLSTVIMEVKEKFPEARMWDADISRMLKAEKDSKYLSKLIREDYISKKQANTYKKILSDPLWKSLKDKRQGLDGKARKIFNQKREMKVFDYNEAGEKSVVMSPMDSIRYHHQLMQIGSVSMDPNTGNIKTWIGGIGNKFFKYDHVRSNRQVGSTFKPFVYATAISQGGISPCYQIKDIRYEIPAGDPNFKLLESWSPDNSDGKFTGALWTLKDGLKKSKNSISLGLLKEMGSVEPIRDLVDRLGIPKKKIPKAPSIILGSAQVNVLEMTAAYSTFANYGMYNSPKFITRIEDNEGQVIYTSVPKQQRVLSEKYNEAILHLVQYASSDHTWQLGTDQWGGKTGTTNDYVDGWFMGVSPELVVGTWVGGEYNWIRFLSIRQGSGGAMARPFFFKFMQRLEADPSIKLNKDAYFKIPEGDRLVTDCSQFTRPEKKKPAPQEDRARKIKEINDFWEDEFGERNQN